MKFLTRMAVVAVMISLAGCGAFRVSCNDMTTYAASEDLPALKVPLGLEAPDTRSALKIPPLTEPERVRAESEGCLESPPSYSTPRADAKKP
jgi:uncharacterized lipoprotein